MNEIKVKVFGIGGIGLSTINKMLEQKLQNVELYAIDPNLQPSNNFKSEQSIKSNHKVIDEQMTHLNNIVNQEIILKHKEEIEEALKNADMIFIVCETDSNSISIAQTIEESAKNVGALNIGMVTNPFQFEDNKDLVEIENLKKCVDALINIPSKNITDKTTELEYDFEEIENVIYRIIKAILDMILPTRLIMIDFADLVLVLKNSGTAIVGIGSGYGVSKIVDACKQALSNDFSGKTIEGATSVIINITANSNLNLWEVEEVVDIVKKTAGEKASIVLGAGSDDNLNDELIVTIIATGFDS